MELEGLGISFVGRQIWAYANERHHRYGSCIPWEYIQGVNYSLKLLIQSEKSGKPTLSQAETDWTCVWNPASAKDWSCIATMLRGYSMGNCLLVFDHVNVSAPPTFWSFLENLIREGRVNITRVWIHTSPPAWIPDAVFFPPLADTEMDIVAKVLLGLPSRNSHGQCRHFPTLSNILVATREQGLGVVVTDVEESEWTLLWHRMGDSRPSLEILSERAAYWMEVGVGLLKSHSASTNFLWTDRSAE
jgi:hypothetical protein